MAMVGAVLSVPMVAYTYDLPGGDFEPGTPISADSVNAKFHSLLDAANELDIAVADLETTVADLQSGTTAAKTLTAWTDRAIRWDEGNANAAEPCWASINTRPGCIISEMSAITHVLIPIDGVPDGTLTDWGMHIGSSNSAAATGWTCDLRYNQTVVGTLDFAVDAAGQWSRYVEQTGMSVPIDNHADGPALGGAFQAGWDVHCVSDGTNGRLDFHQVFVRYQED